MFNKVHSTLCCLIFFAPLVNSRHCHHTSLRISRRITIDRIFAASYTCSADVRFCRENKGKAEKNEDQSGSIGSDLEQKKHTLTDNLQI